MLCLNLFTPSRQDALTAFYQACLPESGRVYDTQGAHKKLLQAEKHYDCLWCLLDGEDIVGTMAVVPLKKNVCELKLLYLRRAYHGRGLGEQLLQKAIACAREKGYAEMYLDTIGEKSPQAVGLYRKYGFTPTERYNDNPVATVFMKRSL